MWGGGVTAHWSAEEGGHLERVCYTQVSQVCENGGEVEITVGVAKERSPRAVEEEHSL